jgi:hypothetical protein
MKDDAVNVLSYWTDMIGPTAYALLPMGVIVMGSILLTAIGREDNRFPFSAETLLGIEEGAPVVGLLGTVVALTGGFNELYSARTEDIPIEAVIRILSECLYSTAVGLSIGLSSWAVRKGLRAEKSGGGMKNGNVMLLILTVLTLLLIPGSGHAEESTFQIEKSPAVVNVDNLQTTMVKYISRKERRYLMDGLSSTVVYKGAGTAVNRQDESRAHSRGRYLNALLRMEEIKGDIWYRDDRGTLYVYPAQMQGIRKLLYILILTDDWKVSGSLMDTYQNRIFSLRYSTLILTSDNIIKYSGPPRKRYLTEYIPVEVEELFIELIRNMEGSSGEYGGSSPSKASGSGIGGRYVSYTSDIH